MTKCAVVVTITVTTDERPPNWPPQDGEPIGVARTSEYVAWIRDHAPPLLALGRNTLEQRFAVGETYASSVPVSMKSMGPIESSDGEYGSGMGSY